MSRYSSGHVSSYTDWIGKYANKKFSYFARHDSDNPINYEFNSLGYRGPEHVADPDISVFGSSFSFGVGIEYSECWHQQLGTDKVNCYAPAGFLVTNDDIISHYLNTKISSGKVILQLREFKYNRDTLTIPTSPLVFAIDEYKHTTIPTLTYESFLDKAEDNVHPGKNTHKKWASILKTILNL